jgi:hypothetical protein
MSDQKNASFLHYLRTFFKECDSCENGYGTPRKKRNSDETQTRLPLDNSSTATTMITDDDEQLSHHSNKRRCINGQY